MIDLAPLHDPSSGNDWTPAFNEAVRRATPKGESIRFPAGWLTFKSRPNPMGCGIFLQGEGGITSAHLGTCCVAAYDEPDPEAGFFTWDGSDPRKFRGTGGGIAGMSLYRLGGPSGGTAIKLICTDNEFYRAGWWSLQNVTVLAEQRSTWDCCLLADGTNVGREGIRWLNLQGFLASSAKKSVVFRNAVHVNWNGGQVQGAKTIKATEHPVGVWIEGEHSQDIHLQGVSIYGTLGIIECAEFTYTGMAQWIKLAGGHKVKRGIVQAVGCDRLDDSTDHSQDSMKVVVV